MTIESIALAAPSRRAGAKLVVEGVSKRFGGGEDVVQALQPIDLAVGAGEFVTIVGPSGCGKSTLLNIVAGFETPTTGRAVLDGRLIGAPGPERGVVFQQGALFTWMSVMDNVAFVPRGRSAGCDHACIRGGQAHDHGIAASGIARGPAPGSGQLKAGSASWPTPSRR